MTAFTSSAEQTQVSTHAAARRLRLACNQYPWFTFYQREGRDWSADLDAALSEVAQSGIPGFEPLMSSPAQLQRLAPLLEKYGLEMRSLYVNSTLHERDEAERNIEQVLAIAEVAQPVGVKLIVTNPSPIDWGGPENKNDVQLDVQAMALDRLGRELRTRGLTLAYHHHDAEMRQAAREFHHMMVATDPEYVTLCLDAHWIYRGTGNSQLALFDIVHLYGMRISEVHLRQSIGGIWTETFCAGDIDYPRLARELCQLGIRPHLVLEQAVESNTPHTMGAVAAHRESLSYAVHVFAALT